MSRILQHHHCQVSIYPDLPALSRAAAEFFVKFVNETLHQHGICHVALTGGSTPRTLYNLLAEPEVAEKLNWSGVHLYFGDERYVPHDASDSNYHMARTSMLDKLNIPADNVHPIPTAAGDAASDARHYARLLLAKLDQDQGVPVFDLILLGMGEDGHTASLFPDTAILRETSKPVAAVYVDKLSSWRISLTYPVLNAARHVLFLVSGAGKAHMVSRVFNNLTTTPVPIQQVRPAHTCGWYLDADAARELAS